MMGDSLIEDPNRIEAHIVKHFRTQFTEATAIRSIFQGLAFKQINAHQNTWLTRPFEEVEIDEILDTLVEDKAPGLDGFPMEAIKRSQSFMKVYFISMIQDFHKTGRLEWRLNTTLLVLIPKKADASWITDYRPISLVSSMYKILAKLLQNRLKQCLPDIISHYQRKANSGWGGHSK